MPIGKVYAQTVVNPTGAIRTASWTAIKDIKAPFRDADDGKKFGYWFNYFWEEARQVEGLTEGDKARLCDAFNLVLTRSLAGLTPVDLNILSIDKKRQVLTTLLIIGFQRVSLKDIQSTPGSNIRAEQAIDGNLVFLNNMKYLNQGNTNTISLGFRADGRTYDQIVTQGGLKARARSKGQGVYGDYGLDQPWHPFSLDIYAESLFLRKGINKDNCLHTVVSVSLEFAEILPYPLLSDASLFPWANTPLTSWTPEIEISALTHRYKVRAVKDPVSSVIDHLESEIRIFVLRTDTTKAFSTQKWQSKVGVSNPFPEAAVDSIPVENILAEIEITRKHFFDNGDLTFYDFQFKSMTLLPSEDGQKKVYGDNFPTDLRLKLNMLERTARNTWIDAKNRYERIKSQANAPRVGGNAALVECPKCHKMVKKITLSMPCDRH